MKAVPQTRTIGELLELRSHRMLSANPEYQRGEVWSTSQKKRLIDSILRGYPIPLIYLHHMKTQVAGAQRDDFEVIDGQQRINAIYEFKEGAFKLFDPKKDAAEARFPSFIENAPCAWGSKSFDELPEQLQAEFLATKLQVVNIETDVPNEARDLFIRLQAGMPLNSQEKRDAWPGSFTEFVLRLGGKPSVARFPGHDFFSKVMRAKATSRGEFRQLAAQMFMLFHTRRNSGSLCDINKDSIDSFYYRHLDFDDTSLGAKRFREILTHLTQLLGDGKRTRVIKHEAIHLMLLVDGLLDDYTRSWTTSFAEAFDTFRTEVAKAKKHRYADPPPVHWTRYAQLTRVNSDRAETIQLRHEFFAAEMAKHLRLILKDPKRIFGSIERELIYARDSKLCQVCKSEVLWDDHEIHHVHEHSQGGVTELANGALVHRHCHPKGSAAKAFASSWKPAIDQV